MNTTVSELIAELSKLDPNAEVMRWNSQGDLEYVCGVEALNPSLRENTVVVW